MTVRDANAGSTRQDGPDAAHESQPVEGMCCTGRKSLNFRDTADVWRANIQQGRIYRSSQFYR